MIRRVSERESPWWRPSFMSNVIRFVDLRFQGTGYRFSFWTTTVDRFFLLNGSSAWDTWADFESAATAAGMPADQIKRCKETCPDWVFNTPPAMNEKIGDRETFIEWLDRALDEAIPGNYDELSRNGLQDYAYDILWKKMEERGGIIPADESGEGA